MAIDRVLSTNTPTFIDDMRISTFTLGNRAPRIESARSGHDLHAADRSGKSDPFVVFALNGPKVIRSKVRKKTLDPEWGEEFEIAIVRADC
ncbi:hypothetical protein JOM56_000885 [Amanita muscaria]